ncbi:MAG: hypothetical protein H6861_02770 [Rhodospirillales bacterium]|nr:hypothetical protein [Rhodospirillales bacterium]
MSEADDSHAQSAVTQSERLSLAKEFLARMRRGFNAADKFMQGAVPATKQSETITKNILPEGEQLLFEVYLSRRLKLDNVIFGRVKDQKIALSLKDFAAALDLPITVNAQTQTAQGWYIRENKTFNLDVAAKTARTDNGEFSISDTVFVEDEDIFVPTDELAQWLGFEIEPLVSSLQMIIKPSPLLPLQERIEREKKLARQKGDNTPQLPLRDEPKQLIDVPFVNVATNSRYNRAGDSGRSNSRHSANVSTAGDFAYGTLSTQTQINDEDQISNIWMNYKQESLEPDLLGPVKAKRFELGDVIQTRLPIDAQVRRELGTRITNVDPLRSFTNPSTAISGTVFPDWDVELYRGNQFLGYQRVGNDGFYSFDNVILYGTENIFRVVFYGPQGEQREEEVSIPVDINRVAEGGGVYDVSLTFDNKQTYRKADFNDEDEGTPTLMALYEKPIAPGTVGSLGLRSQEQNGERNNVAYGGISTLLGETLVNANLAVDDEADFSSELVARRNIGSHDLYATARYFTDNYDTISSGDDTLGGLNTRLNANGKLPISIGRNPRYEASFNYNLTNDGDSTTDTGLGFNTAYKNFTFNEKFNYATAGTAVDDRLNSVTGVAGVFGRNRMRLLSDYQIKPDSKLSRVVASYNHDFDRTLDLDVEVERRIDPSITEASAQLNWQAGWARISPSVRYNTENDFFAGLNTNFGFARDPQGPGIKMFDRNITGNGAMSVFVFLDANGDGRYNEGEERLEDVTIRALQNGGREVTDENGMAFFSRVQELKRTDIVLEEESLKDPYWVSGFEGVSILPREGYVAELQFPVHIAGEMDGTLYARKDNGQPMPLKNIALHLYNADGEIEQTAQTDIGGFYLFNRVRPGRYLLVVDQQAARNNNFARPKPEAIEIGYEGTIIYGHDVYVDAGTKDIPSTIIAGLEDYKARHPHIDFEQADYNIALNLGEYNSRLLMSTVWYRLHTRYRQILSGGQLMVLPEHSFADTQTGKHTLRVGFHDADIDDAYNRCRALIARNIECTVEVLPAAAAKFANIQPGTSAN